MRVMSEDDSFLQGKDMIFLAVVIPVIFITIVIISLIADSIAVKSFDVKDLKQSLMVNRLLYSEDCFAAKGKIGVVDMGKFTDERIAKCLDVKDENIGVKVDLKYNNLEKSVRVNELMTNRDFLCGKKGVFCSEKSFYALVEDNIEYGGYMDVLIIEIAG